MNQPFRPLLVDSHQCLNHLGWSWMMQKVPALLLWSDAVPSELHHSSVSFYTKIQFSKKNKTNQEDHVRILVVRSLDKQVLKALKILNTLGRNLAGHCSQSMNLTCLNFQLLGFPLVWSVFDPRILHKTSPSSALTQTSNACFTAG